MSFKIASEASLFYLNFCAKNLYLHHPIIKTIFDSFSDISITKIVGKQKNFYFRQSENSVETFLVIFKHCACRAYLFFMREICTYCTKCLSKSFSNFLKIFDCFEKWDLFRWKILTWKPPWASWRFPVLSSVFSSHWRILANQLLRSDLRLIQSGVH